MATPPGLTPSQFSTALDALASAIGRENVSKDSESGLRDYVDPWPLSHTKHHDPGAAVRPRSVEHVQDVLRIANEHKIPLWTISKGKNLGYGGPAPVVEGSVVLDMGSMNRVIEVNKEFAYAIVEPGVTFFDLFEEIKRQDLDLWISCPALGWGSVIGNCLDRGIGYTPKGDHSAQQCGMEVVLPNGEVLRTGMGAMNSSSAWPLYKGGYGPSVDGLFFQSNLGVVTKMGIHLYPAPKTYISCEVHVPKEEDLGTLISRLAELQRRGVLENFPSICNPFRTAFTGMQNPAVASKLGPYLGKKAAVPDSAAEGVVAELGLGHWVAHFAVYGTDAMTAATWQEIQDSFATVPGSKCVGVKTKGPEGKPMKADAIGAEGIPHTGVPSLAAAGSWDYRGPGGGHTCFAPIIPPSAAEMDAWYIKAKKRVADAGFDFLADFHVFPRYILAIIVVVYTIEEAETMDRLYQELVEDSTKAGYTEYRTHVRYMDQIASHFTYNDSILRRYVEQLKDLTDPNGILSLGKQGIWGNSSLARAAKSQA